MTFPEFKISHFKSPGRADDAGFRLASVSSSEITTSREIHQGSFVALRDDKSAPELHLDALPTATADPKKIKVAGISISHPGRMVSPSWRSPVTINGLVSGFYLTLRTARSPSSAWSSSIPRARGCHGQTSWISSSGISAAPWNEVLGAALLLRYTPTELGLTTVVKTSCGKRLHILLYLKRTHEWDVMKNFAKAMALAVSAHSPKRFIVTATKTRRSGIIFIDWLRNGRGSTCIAPWSLRARPGATVSMPVNWADLRETVAGGFTIREPVTPPIDWLELKPQAIAKGTLKRLGVIADQ